MISVFPKSFLRYARITAPALSESVITITPLSLAAARISAAFSGLLNMRKPSVGIISASITFSSVILSYFPSTITGRSSLINAFTLCYNIYEPHSQLLKHRSGICPEGFELLIGSEQRLKA